ncbi:MULTISPECIES: BlaI/MecI/CopY family transcriptional regulator [Carboxydothermus]|uniref:Transcriptional regulator n=2 Tax=Carboxydothermus TaxID=129957 RepID=Q3AAB7_CARHZ|nr:MULTISPECIES: BlaI/MecI/CopY family transcriptional regulator [Carboxydothermus]ABB15994.1 conserved hypothetical protein [Carboxydothermus hydrogenoformans Z-2901]NYE58811.1 putative transcriptional regulator [Carboxydothermus ferrireducens DSM 11255]
MSWLEGEFKPQNKGVAKVLGELEARVMEIIWDLGEATVKDVHQIINQEKKLAYTTILTIMGRLADKGLLIKKSIGLAHSYTPAVSREEFYNKVAETVVDGLFEEFAEPAFTHFLKKVENDPQKLAELEKMLLKIKEQQG